MLILVGKARRSEKCAEEWTRRGERMTEEVTKLGKIRLDVLLAARGVVSSRERAQALIMAGQVLVDGQKVEKAGAKVAVAAELRLLGDDLRYVSRGGLKLERALAHWGLGTDGITALDIGTSTGGFTDCLLQHGAAGVIGVDTGYGQIDTKLRADARVTLLERMNARYLEAANLAPLAGAAEIGLVVMDVSFISATLVLPAVLRAVLGCRSQPTALELVLLVKPQFEVGKGLVGKGGIVRDEAAQLGAAERVAACAGELGFQKIDVIDSPIRGTEGNREFLLYGVIGVAC